METTSILWIQKTSFAQFYSAYVGFGQGRRLGVTIGGIDGHISAEKIFLLVPPKFEIWEVAWFCTDIEQIWIKTWASI